MSNNLGQRSIDEPTLSAGMHFAKVIGSADSKYMGALQVQLLGDIGTVPNTASNTLLVKYLSPFYGVTNVDHNGPNNSYGDTQKSYGMWMVPPDPGVIVLVTFVGGNVKNGFWLGCVPDEYMNFMIPGLAATSASTEPGPTKQVVGEYNKKYSQMLKPDVTTIPKPVHPFQQVLTNQGLALDEVRGITTSSARREAPSNVYGISTPGPIDRSNGAPKGRVGTTGGQVIGAFVSRLGGTTFVMDDGDDNFLRTTPASSGPPVYASVENGDTSGLTNIPQNELFRIRTRTGHQILLHNSEDLIYIANAKGTTWIELTSNGKIDIWANDDISCHTAGNYNVTADKNINLQAGGSINMISGTDTKIQTGNNYEVTVGKNGLLTVAGNNDILISGNQTGQATTIVWNGPTPNSASAPLTPTREPMTEPWSGHENLFGTTPISSLDTFLKTGK